MIFFNKLILVDLFLLAGFISLFFAHAGAAQHFNHYKSYRKFY
jgi:hypothetical protein